MFKLPWVGHRVEELTRRYEDKCIALDEAIRTIDRMQYELDNLRHPESTPKKFDIAEYMDPTPTDSAARREFLAQWTAYFRGGLHEKIKHLIARQKEELAKFPITEREADFFRAGINFGELLNEWGDDIVSEYNAVVAGERGTSDAFSISSSNN